MAYLSLVEDEDAEDMYVTNVSEKGEFEALAREGASRVKVRYLLEKSAGASYFYLRYYVVEEGGHTPLDRHGYEHEVFELEGRGVMVSEDREIQIKPGDAIYLGPNDVHQFRNLNREPLVFLCVTGDERMYRGNDPARAVSED